MVVQAKFAGYQSLGQGGRRRKRDISSITVLAGHGIENTPEMAKAFVGDMEKWKNHSWSMEAKQSWVFPWK